MKKKWLIGLMALCLSCATIGFVGCGESDGTNDGENTEQNSGTITPDSGGEGSGGDETPISYTVTYEANGGTFSNGATSITDTVQENGKLTAPESPSRKNYSFSGWGSKNGNDMWDFATDTVTENTTLYATWKQKSAIILSVDGASIEEKEIFMLVDGETDSVSLADKVICSDDSTWKLYYDKLGQMEIPTKIAAGKNGYLQEGSNEFYVVVTSKDGIQVNVYEMNVYRSYLVGVSYFDGEKLLYSDSAYTGYEYVADYVPDIKGYTFNYWKDESIKFDKTVIWSGLTLYADKTPNTYTVTYDVNGGNELSATEKELTYGNTYKLAKPTRTGYTFLGWSYNGTLLTDGTGNSLLPWDITEDVTLTAEWQINQYTVTLNKDVSNGGTVSGANDYDYNSEVTITASTNNGYVFLGWYNGDELLAKELSYKFPMPAENVTYTARWITVPVTLEKNNASAGSISSLDGKYLPGDEATVTATTNNGYVWLGWYNGDELLTKELSYNFPMPTENVTYTAKWIAVPVTLERNNTSAGIVSSLNGKYLPGDEATVTATTNNGYVWLGWYNGDELLTKELSYKFPMPTENVTYTARWIAVPVTLEKNNASAGSISSLNGKYLPGDEATVTATTNNGYVWLGWYNGDELLTKELSYKFPMPTENVTYTARWIAVPVTLEKNNASAGSISSLDGKYLPGDEATVTATTNNGYVWLGWYNGDELLTKELSYKFPMPTENVTYTAKWIAVPVTLERNNTSAGIVSSLNGKYLPGDEATVTATTNNGYVWLGWYNGDELLTKELSYKFPMPTENVTYTARWIAVPVTLEKNNASAGSISSLNGKYLPGDEATVTATTLNCAYLFKGWYDGEKLLTEERSYTFQMPTENVTYTATWELIEGMEVFNFTSNKTACTVTGLKDKTITELIIPDCVTSIGSSAFNDCDSLTSVVIGDSVTSIGYEAFYNCDSLTSVEIGNSVTSIGDYAFYCCDSLQYNEYGNCKYLGNKDNAYYVLIDATNANYSNFTIHEETKIIAGDAFYYCSRMSSIVIPDSVTSIGKSAFNYCDSLTSVYYKGTAEEWAKISISSGGNGDLTSATRYYYSETKPTATGNYWHYVDGVPTKW